MNHYTSYIAKQLALAALVISASLTAIVWLTQALRFIDFIVNRGVSTFTFLKLTALMVPSLLFVVLPFALFVSVLFVYNKLMSDSELVVLQAAGLSRFQLAKPVLWVAGGATLFAYFISLYALPVTYRQFKDMQTFLRDNYASLLLQEEVFNTPVEGLTVFVREREPSGLLRGILVHDNSDPSFPITMMAQEGQLQQTSEGPRFLLYNGNRQEVKKGRMSFLAFDRYTVDLSFYTKKVSTRNRKPEEFFLGELFEKAEEQPYRAAELLAEAHHRLIWPLYNFALGLFAVVMLLGGEFNRRGNWRRMTVSVLSALAIVAVGMSLQNLVGRDTMMIPLLYLTIGAVLSGSFWLSNERKHKPVPAGEEEANA